MVDDPNVFPVQECDPAGRIPTAKEGKWCFPDLFSMDPATQRELTNQERARRVYFRVYFSLGFTLLTLGFILITLGFRP